MKLTDNLEGPTGHFVLEVRDRDGVLVERIDEPNLIVNGSKPTHAHLLGGDVANRSITQIQFGTSGAAVAGGNTVITSPFTKAVDLVDYPTTESVRFAFSLASGENNGMAIMEFGLLTAAGVLYARKVRTVALNKESDLSFSGTWTITF